MDRRSLLRRSLPVVLAGLAGCTGDGSGGTTTATDSPASTDSPTPGATDSPASTDSPTPGATDSPTPAATPTDSPTPTDASTPTPDQQVLVAPGGEFRFEPETFTLERGATVLWTWEDGGHNVSPGATPADADWPGEDAEPAYPGGHSYAYTFEVAGSYEYHCDPHQSLGMVGSFTVE